MSVAQSSSGAVAICTSGFMDNVILCRGADVTLEQPARPPPAGAVRRLGLARS